VPDCRPYARRNYIFINDRKGGFVDATAKLWKEVDNPAVDDNLAVMLDYDSDGDADVLRLQSDDCARACA
jgi:hypothetical protein